MWLFLLTRDLYLSGMLAFSDTKKVQKGLDCMLRNAISILGSIVNIVGGTYITM